MRREVTHQHEVLDFTDALVSEWEEIPAAGSVPGAWNQKSEGSYISLLMPTVCTFGHIVYVAPV